MRPHPAALALLCAVTATGCLIVGRAAPPPPPPSAPAAGPRIEYALGEFTFQMNERDPAPSTFDARLLGAEIFEQWERRGYVGEAERVDAGDFSPEAAYHVLIRGSVHAESSFWAELLNALTLLLVPYSVTTHYDLQLAVLPSAGGAPYVASARSADKTWIGLLLVVGFPFANRGHDEEVARLADALYVDLQAQGAFAGGGAPTPAAASRAPDLAKQCERP
jgi:hypothetical protein